MYMYIAMWLAACLPNHSDVKEICDAPIIDLPNIPLADILIHLIY